MGWPLSALLMGQVWTLALPRSERDVLLALADHAHDDGTSARPGVPYLVWKTDLARSTVISALRGLEERGIIVPVVEGGGRGNVTEYHIDLLKGPKKEPFTAKTVRSSSAKPSDLATKPSDSASRVITEPSEPSVEQPTPTASTEIAVRSEAAPRPRNQVWDVLVELYGEPVPDPPGKDRHAKARGRIVSDLRALLVRDGVRDAEQAVAEIRRRQAALTAEWGESKATARALVQNWVLAGKLAAGTARPARAPRREDRVSPEELIRRARALDEEGR
jgi:hypothetical protein